MMWWDHGGWGAGEWVAMSFTMVVVWGLLIALVVWIVRSYRPAQDPAADPASASAQHADEVLTERFARGEIDEDEFTRRRQILRSTLPRQ